MYSFCFGTSEYFFEYFFLICFSDLYKATDIRYHHKSDWIKDYVTNNMLKLLRNKFNVAYIKTYTNTNTRKHTNVVPHCVPLWFNCPKNLVYSSDYHSPWDKSALTSLFSYTWCSVYIAFETLFFFVTVIFQLYALSRYLLSKISMGIMGHHLMLEELRF